MLNKTIIALVSISVLFMSGIIVGWIAHSRSQDKAEIKQLKTDAKEVDKHETKETNKAATLGELKSVVVKIPDYTGCLDRDSSNEYLNGLFKQYNTARSTSN